MKTRNLFAMIWAGFSVFLVPCSAMAAEYTAEVRAGVGVSDNLVRSARVEVDDAISTVGFSFGVIEQSNKLDLNIQSQFDFLNYADSAFDSEVVGGLTADVIVEVIDETLRWVFQDNFGQQLFNPFQPARPGNRDDINVFTTGPTLNLVPGSRNPIRVDLRYTRTDFEIQPNDNDRLSSAISIGRELNRESTLSINFVAERAEFDNIGLTAPIENYRGYLRYERSGARNTLSIDAGYNQVEFGGVESDGILFGISLARTTSARGLLTVSAGSQFSDQGDIFRTLQNVATDFRDTADLPDGDRPFLSNFFTVRYLLQSPRFSIDASTNWGQQDVSGGLATDRELYGGDLRFKREVSRKIFAGADIGFRRREFKYQDRRDDDFSLGINVGYRITSGFDVSLEYQHFQRNSVTVNADFTENRAFIRLTYTPVWSR